MPNKELRLDLSLPLKEIFNLEHAKQHPNYLQCPIDPVRHAKYMNIAKGFLSHGDEQRVEFYRFQADLAYYGLPERALHALVQHTNIRSIEDLITKTKGEIINVLTIGEKGFNQIGEMLQIYTQHQAAIGQSS